MKKTMEETQKITAILPVPLLEGALRASGKGLTDTLKEALTQYRQRKACEALMALRGKVKFDLTYEQIKEDRE